MKNVSTALLAALLVLAPMAASAAVPATISFTGRLADAGAPVTGTHPVVFALWDSAAGGTASLWTETRDVTVQDGVLAVALGEVVALPAGLFNGVALFLEITVDGVVMSPRMAIQSVPYAIKAGLADTATSALSMPWTGVTGKPTFTCVEQLPTSANPQTVAAGIGNNVGPTITCPAGYQAVAANVWYSSYFLSIWDLRATSNYCWVLMGNTSATWAGSFYASCRCCAFQ